MTAPLRIIFAGTPDFAATHLAALLESDHEIVAVLSQPDRPAGRGKKLKPSPVKQLAAAHEVPVLQPLTLKSHDTQQTLRELDADIMVVVAYGLILPQTVLDIPRFGCLNVHASLLPRWRGAAPIQRAVQAGDEVSGVTIMQMEAGLDTGPMLTIKQIPLLPDETGGSLHDRLAEIGPEALLLHSTTSTLLWPQRNPRTTTRQITRIKLLKKSTRSSGKITQGPSLDESERLTLPPTASAFWVASESNSGWRIREKTAATPLQAP